MSSDAVMYIPRFIKIWSGIQKLIGGYTDTQTHRRTDTRRQHGDLLSLHLFFQNKESRLKMADRKVSISAAADGLLYYTRIVNLGVDITLIGDLRSKKR
jgi:hypothetical protein